MKVRSLGWLGVRSGNADAMAAFYRDVLCLEPLAEQSTGTRFLLGDGTEVHVYDAADADHDFFGSGPVVGFRVEDFAALRGAMIERGIEFLYPEPQRQAGLIWQHFRAPDGNVYEIIGNDEHATGSIRLREISASDPALMAAAFASIGWARSKPREQFDQYLREHEAGRRAVRVALVDEQFAGYVTLNWTPRYPPFAERGAPEVEDLNVLPPFRRRGVATLLMDDVERMAAERSAVVGIGVGLHPGYNAAQRMYVERGYVPDGNGVAYRDVLVEEGQTVVMDDDLILHLVKSLRGP